MESNHISPAGSVLRGGVGVSGALLGVVSTHLNEVEQWLRVSSAFVGLVVAVLTAFSLATGLGKAKRRRRHHRILITEALQIERVHLVQRQPVPAQPVLLQDHALGLLQHQIQVPDAPRLQGLQAPGQCLGRPRVSGG